MCLNLPEEKDRHYLEEAFELSVRALPSQTAFSVGSLIVLDAGVVGTGYSREWGAHWHAEAVAIEKAKTQQIQLARATLYTSLEPCSVRKSGRQPCCELIVQAGIHRVVFGAKEPPLFVNGEGMATLQRAGLEVIEMSFLNSRFESLHQHLLGR